LALARALLLALALSEPDPGYGDADLAGTGYAFIILANVAGTGGGVVEDGVPGRYGDCAGGAGEAVTGPEGESRRGGGCDREAARVWWAWLGA